MWRLDAQAALPCWRLSSAPDGLRLAFTTRRGGVSDPPYDSLNLGRTTGDREHAVGENRRRALAALGSPGAQLATAGLVHGARVVEVRGAGHTPDCDALLTRERALVLAVTTADCLPLILTAEGIVAVAHCGWRGTAAGLPKEVLSALCLTAGATAREITAHLGPCIRSCCYEVGPEVARQFPASVCARVGGRHRLDLAAAARLQLLESGVPPGAILDTAACTCCEPGWYYSHRRDGSRSGRHWALVGMS